MSFSCLVSFGQSIPSQWSVALQIYHWWPGLWLKVRLSPSYHMWAKQLWETEFVVSTASVTVFTSCHPCLNFSFYCCTSSFIFFLVYSRGVFHSCITGVCVGDAPLHSAWGLLSFVSIWWAERGWRKKGKAPCSSRSHINSTLSSLKSLLALQQHPRHQFLQLTGLTHTPAHWSTKSLVLTALIHCVSLSFLPVWWVSASAVHPVCPPDWQS